jgi:hypothetical protein
VGIDAHGFEFLAACHRDGVNFERTAMLGHQNVSGITRKQVSRTHLDPNALASLSDGDFADPLFETFGAASVVSIDASDFEDASEVADLNRPIPEHLRGRFSAVLDGGTIEHVFDVKQALTNAMEMVSVDGHLMLITPTSGSSGHGFFQFSPELFWRALSAENGYRVEAFHLRDRASRRWYKVADPDVLGRRAEFRTRGTTYLYIRARRTDEVTPFAIAPQQSDYAREWSGHAHAARRQVPGFARRIYGRARTLRDDTLGTYLFDHEAFVPVSTP